MPSKDNWGCKGFFSPEEKRKWNWKECLCLALYICENESNEIRYSFFDFSIFTKAFWYSKCCIAMQLRWIPCHARREWKLRLSFPLHCQTAFSRHGLPCSQSTTFINDDQNRRPLPLALNLTVFIEFADESFWHRRCCCCYNWCSSSQCGQNELGLWPCSHLDLLVWRSRSREFVGLDIFWQHCTCTCMWEGIWGSAPCCGWNRQFNKNLHLRKQKLERIKPRNTFSWAKNVFVPEMFISYENQLQNDGFRRNFITSETQLPRQGSGKQTMKSS